MLEISKLPSKFHGDQENVHLYGGRNFLENIAKVEINFYLFFKFVFVSILLRLAQTGLKLCKATCTPLVAHLICRFQHLNL